MRVQTAQHIGRTHLLDGRNRQDALRVVEGDSYVIGVICDGCSEGQYSEVGANLGAEIFSKFFAAMARWRVPVLLNLESMVESRLKAIVDINVYSEDVVDFVHDYLLFTVIGFIWTPAETVVFWQGDGTLWVNDEVQHLNVGNTPFYPAYRLIRDALPAGMDMPDFTIGRYTDVKRIAIGSDAWKDEPELADKVWDCFHLQRQINIWSDRQHRFKDDVSLIALEVTE